MLVKEGHKGSYLLWGVVQIILAVVLIALTIPFMLSFLGIDTGVWLELAQKVQTWVGGKYIYGAIHAIFVIVFASTVLSIFFRRSGASLFVKLSAAAAMFPFACLGLANFVFAVSGKAISIMQIFNGGLNYLLLAASVVLLILAFVFQFTVSRNSEKKANAFLFTKSIVWIALLTLNFVIPSILNSSLWLVAILGYLEYFELPYFLCWYFLVMGIMQLISSPQLINPQDSKFSTGTPPMQAIPVAYIPVQPVMVDPFTPVMPGNPALKGRRQGLDAEQQTQNADQTQEQIPIQEGQPQNLENESAYQPDQQNEAAVYGDSVTQGLAEPESANDSFIAAPQEETPYQEPPQEEQNINYDNIAPISEPVQETYSEPTNNFTMPQSENVENYAEPVQEQNAYVAKNDTVTQGLTPPEGFNEIQTLDQIQQQNAPVQEPVAPAHAAEAPAKEKPAPKKKATSTKATAPKKAAKKDTAAETKTEVKSMKKARTVAPKAEPEKVETKPVKPKKVSAPKPTATKPKTTKPKVEPQKEQNEPKELSQDEKLKEIDKIIKTLSSPRQASRTRKIRRDVDEE